MLEFPRCLRKNSFLSTGCLCFLFFLTVAVNLSAQDFSATLSGRVSDPNGATVSAARVVIVNAGTNAAVTVNTDDDGFYTAPFLLPGTYTVSVEHAGFEKSIREGVVLQVAQKATLDMPLSIGQMTQSVTVTGDAALLQTETADRGLTMESNRVANTPLQGRNIFAQAWSAPGVVVTASVQRLRPFDTGGSSSIVVSGGRSGQNEDLMDGTSTLSQGSVAFVPTAEAVGEFKVQTTNFDAQYGWTSGGVVNIVSRGGTNQYHGSVFEFLQNTVLDANTFNSNRTGQRRSASHINTFGGHVEGPVLKNKLFFSFTYENLRQSIPDPFIVSVPTALQKQGDFSQTYYGLSSSGAKLLQTIYDPFSTTTGPNGTLVRTPFQGNIIPASMQNPVALAVLSHIPNGNIAGNPITGLSNLTNGPNNRKFTDFFPEYTGRGDYVISDATRMFIRYSRNALQEQRGFIYSTVSQLNPADTTGNSPFTRENHNATAAITHTFNATTFADIRFGLERFKSASLNNPGSNFNIASLGFSPDFVGQASPWFPQFTFAGYNGAGTTPGQISPIAQTTSVSGGIYKGIGKHDLKFGGDFRLLRNYSQVQGNSAGQFSFDQTFTGANPLAISPSSGNSIASFLLGTPQSGSIQVVTQPARQQWLLSGFVQDDIRVTERLKLNLGLRWDYQSAITDRFNALPAGFDTTVASPLQAAGISLQGGLRFAGANGNPRGINRPDRNNFGPRAGFAYRLDDHTVLRGGYAMMYAYVWDDPGNAPGFSQTTNMVTSVQAGVPANTLTDPFPTGILRPVGSSLGLSTALGQSIVFGDPDRKVPYVHQYSFEIQRELPKQFLASVGYVGSHAKNLEVTSNLNVIPLSDLSLGATALSASVSNPLAGLIPGTSLNAGTIQRSQLLRAFPQFLNVTEQYLPVGSSSYNSMQAMLYKRLSFGLNLSVAYTWAKQMDQNSYRTSQNLLFQDTQLEKQVASWDVRNSIQLNGVYQLPFGAGKKFGDGAPKPLRWAMGGWELSAIARLQGGLPVTSPSGAAPTGVSPVLSDPNLSQWFNSCTQLANGSLQNCQPNQQPAWTIQQPYTLQTWSTRLDSVRQPPVRNLDMSLMKHNHIGERADLIFRTDALNVTNTPQFFSGLSTNVTSPQFGQISGVTDQTNLPRFFQFSMKLVF